MAELLGRSEREIWSLRSLPGAPIVKAGRRVYFRASAIDDFLDSLDERNILRGHA
ncbi:MAG: hypothetical protein HOV87_34585 [Catenulispora sp.]|nr:hypothetical protein [Catenulispora sp.]